MSEKRNMLNTKQMFHLSKYLELRAAGADKKQLFEKATALADEATKALGFTCNSINVRTAARNADLMIRYAGGGASRSYKTTKATKADLLLLATALHRFVQLGQNFDGKGTMLAMLKDVVDRNGADA